MADVSPTEQYRTELDPGDEPFKAALDHAWNWFEFHAGQRMQAINFFVVATGFIIGGFVAAITRDEPTVAAGIAFLGALLTSALFRLDQRNHDLVKFGENALMVLEAHLAAKTHTPEINFVGLADRKISIDGGELGKPNGNVVVKSARVILLEHRSLTYLQRVRADKFGTHSTVIPALQALVLLVLLGLGALAIRDAQTPEPPRTSVTINLPAP